MIIRISLREIPEPEFIWPRRRRRKMYTEVSYEPDCYIMFGKESAGIPEEILVENEEDCVRFPWETESVL